MTNKRGTISSSDQITLSLYWQTIRSQPKLFWRSNLVLVSAVAINIVAPYATSNILARLIQPGANLNPYLVLFAVAAIIGVLSNRIGFMALMEQAANIAEELRLKAFNMLLQRSIGFHNNSVGGKIISDTIDFPRAFNTINGLIYIELLPFLVTMVVGLGIIFWQDAVLGTIMLTMSVLIIGWAWLFSYYQSEERNQRKEVQRDVYAHIGDTISNIMTVKSFGQEQREETTQRRLSKKLEKLQVRDWVKVGTDGSNRHFALLLIQFGFIAYLIYKTKQDPSSLAIGIFAFTYSLGMTNRLFQVNAIIRQYEEAMLEANPMSKLLQKQIEIQDAPDASKLRIKTGQIDILDMSFTYPDGDDAVFSNLTLSVKPGERIGLVGPSGGGKSSLMRLLLRFNDVTSGSIKIDGQNISLVTQKSLRDAIAYVPQEPLLFHRTIRDNLLYGVEGEVTEENLIAAAKRAHAYSFISKLPQGFETIVGERGVKLSGGQRQRIAIARAILRDAPILLLDEATSALDSISEKHIQAALATLMKNKTVVVIAHRLSTINELDRIVVINDGKIIEEGSHKQLLKLGGHYSDLWQHQTGGFLSD